MARGKKKLIEQYENLYATGKANIGEKLQIVKVCRDMGWTYEQYLSNPSWFSELMVEMDQIEKSYQKLWRKKRD